MRANPARKREPIDIAIKSQIRLHHEEKRNLSIKEMVTWAEEKYGIPFLPATMRTILFPKPTKSGTSTSLQMSYFERQRERSGNWPELEFELASWYMSLSVPPKGEELKKKAEDLWQPLAAKFYQGQELPTFGNNWRDKFKQRHGLKLKKQTEKCTPKHQACFNPDHINSNEGTHTASASISSVMDGMVPCTEGIHRNYSTFADVQHFGTTYTPGFSDSIQPIAWDENRRSSTGQIYPEPLSMTSTKVNTAVVRNDVSRTIQTAQYNKPLPSSELKALNIQHGILDNHVRSSDVDLGALDQKSSNSAEKICRCRTRTRDNNCQGPNADGYTAQVANHAHPSIPILLHDSKYINVIRESVSRLLISSLADEQIDPALFVKFIIEVLISDLEAAKSRHAQLYFQQDFCRYNKSVYSRLGANILQSLEALKLLHLAKKTEIKVPTLKEWPEWESQLIFDDFIFSPSPSPLRSHDCGLDDRESISAFNLNKDKKDLFQQRYQDKKRNRRTKDPTSIFSIILSLGRVDVRTSTIQGLSVSGTPHVVAEVILTLHNLAQLRFSMQPKVTLEDDFSIMSTLSIRKTIPCESEVFKIAAMGTVGELIKIFSEGKASPEDCDLHGRSLINYALSATNVETAFYLLGFVTDIDKYESDGFGYFMPLSAITMGNYSELTDQNRTRRMQCFTKMIHSGADSTLEFDVGGGQQNTLFREELTGGSKEAVEAILNSEQPLISPNSFGDGVESKISPILCLANDARMGCSERFDMIDKFKLLIKRGADIEARSEHGMRCLHVILAYHSLSLRSSGPAYRFNYFELKYILMAFVAANGDLKALDDFGRTPSDIACIFGNEAVWIESLAASGRNPWDILSLESDYLKIYPGTSVFLATNIIVRPTKLSFQEFFISKEFSEANELGNAENTWAKFEFIEDLAMDGQIVPNTGVTLHSPKLALVGQIGVDEEDEYWFGGACNCGHCLYADEEVEEEASISFAKYYRPINGDSSWLTYIYRPQYIFYPAGLDPGDEDSDDWCSCCHERSYFEDDYDDEDDEMDLDGDEGSSPGRASSNDRGCAEGEFEEEVEEGTEDSSRKRRKLAN